MKQLTLVVVGIALTATPALRAQERIVPDGMQRVYDNFHYAPIVKVGNTLYLSGVVAGDEDPEQQFESVFRNLDRVLQAAGSSLADVVEMTTFHVNMREHVQTFMTVKDRFMKEPYPTWTAIGVESLFSPRSLVEIRVVAILSD